MMSFTRLAFALLGVASIGVNQPDACSCRCCRQPAAAPASKPMPMHDHAANGAPDAKTMQVKLAVSGMSCAACVSKVQKAITSVPGVKQVQVDLAKQQAIVTVEADKCDEPALVKAVEKAGYGAKVMK